MKKIFVMVMILSSFLYSVVYENAEDGSVNRWVAVGATVNNVIDDDTGSKVIKFSSDTYKYYRMGSLATNSDNKIKWDIKTNRAFIAYVNVSTTDGDRLFYYTIVNRDYAVTSSGIHHGLGSFVADGEWHTISRDLDTELHESEPTNNITAIKWFKIRAIDDVFVDNIIGSSGDTPVTSCSVIEDGEDANIDKWTAPEVTVTNESDVDTGSNIIKLTSDVYKYSRMDNLNYSANKIKWDIKTDRAFIAYVYVSTTDGDRLFYYTIVNRDYGVTSSGIHHGLGESVADGEWHTISRDLDAELHESEPSNNVTDIKSFKIRAIGDTFIDNMKGCDSESNSSTPPMDIIKPVITLKGDNQVTLLVGDEYTDAGATAFDNIDGNITTNIQIVSNVNTAVVGRYTVTYVVSDTAGNVADTVSRTVIINEVIAIQKGTVSGRVVDISGNAILDATISIDNHVVNSNATGNFIVNEVLVSNRIIINVSKNGYFNNSKIIQVQKDLETVVSFVLSQEQSNSFSSSDEVVMNAVGGGSLEIPSDSYISEDGTAYNGNIDLALNYYAISSSLGRDMFPGNFDAINSLNERGILQSYGFMTISLEDSLGNALQLNGQADITIPADLSLGTPPATIPLWYYDEEQGVWIEDGIATYDEATESYQGVISRIATYNIDIFMNPGNLKVCVENIDGNKLSNAYIKLSNTSGNWFAQVGPTDNSGYLNILNVMGNTNLNLSAYTVDGKYGVYNNNPIVVTPNSENELPSCIVITDGNATLTGIVQELQTGTKLEGVKAVLRTGSIYLKETISDENGVYNFANISSGLTYSIDYFKSNYTTTNYNEITVADNQIKILEAVNLSRDIDTLVGTVSGTVTNVLTGNGVESVTLKVRVGLNNQDGIIVQELQTLADGTYSSSTLRHGSYTVEAIKNGFITTYFTITVLGGDTSLNQNGSISPSIANGDMRMILTWGETPSDLDSHLVRKTNGIQDYHVYFGHKNDTDASLDLDDTSSYGPETVTINNLQANSIYTYYIHNYSGGSTGLKTSNAKITVTINGIQQTFNVPNEDGIYWKVFEVVNGETIPCSSECVQDTENEYIVRSTTFRKATVQKTLSSHMSREEELKLFRNLPSK